MPKDEPAERLSDAAIEAKLNLVERMIGRCVDMHAAAALNACFQRLLEEQVRRDLLKQECRQ